MGEAKKHNGKSIVAYRDGQAIDSEGNVIEGAPKQPKDTDPTKQPGSASAPTPEERMGAAIAAALKGAPSNAHGDEDEGTDSDEEEGLPSLPDMPSHLDSMRDVDAIKAMQKQDKRKGAKPMYKARLEAIKAAE